MITAARRALIAGLGLIGGSIGMALRARGWHVSYVDPHVSIDEARRAAAADERREAIDPDAGLVIVATPVDVAMEILRTMSPAPVTSVCSVMKPLRIAADERNLQFVAGHPIAGSHERSLVAAHAGLFAGKRWFVDRRDEAVEQLISDCGATAETVDCDEHDRAVALTSHLPQLLSTALAANIPDEALRFAGSGLRTFLRLAASDAGVWRSIIAANRDNIEIHTLDVGETLREMLEGDPSDFFERAQRVWRKLENE